MTQPRLILAIVVALVAFAAPLDSNRNSAGRANAADKAPATLAKDIVGVWALAGTPGDVKAPPATGGRLKFIMKKSWTMTEADPNSGVVVYHHGGTFTLDGDKYTETVDYANDSTKELIGKTLHFKVKVNGDTLTQEGIDNTFNEVWKRVK
ncbi:MAG TPA: hypothetical protein VGH32_02280 [Pirellulales bacterium]